ncbi:MAG: hypothetical protein AAGF12_00100 [Myxococcota bacterium]
MAGREPRHGLTDAARMLAFADAHATLGGLMGDSDFPLLSAYLAGLPDGLASYPECQTKASIAHTFTDGHGFELRDDLPDSMAEFVRSPPPGGVWTSAVLADAFFHLACDLFYPSEEATHRWCYRRTMRMAESSLYRALFRFSSPRTFFAMSARTSRIFHRGTTITAEELTPDRAVSRFAFPPHLRSRRKLLSNLALSEAMIRLTGGRDPVVTLLEAGPTHALFESRWQA